MVYKHRGLKMSLTPDDLFSRYTEFIFLLLSKALTWSFSLVTLFFHAFFLDLQETVRLGVISYLIYQV